MIHSCFLWPHNSDNGFAAVLLPRGYFSPHVITTHLGQFDRAHAVWLLRDTHRFCCQHFSILTLCRSSLTFYQLTHIPKLGRNSCDLQNTSHLLQTISARQRTFIKNLKPTPGKFSSKDRSHKHAGSQLLTSGLH